MPKGSDGLARQDAARGVGDGARNDDGQAFAGVFHQFVQRKDGGLGVERVEDCFHQEQVAAAFHQSFSLFAVGGAQLIKACVSRTGVVDVGADAGGARRRAQCAGNEARPVGRAVLVSGAAGNARRSHVHFARQVRQAVVFLCDARRAEGVGFDDVGTRGQVLGVDFANHVGPGQHQQVVVALQILRVCAERRIAEVGLAELVALDHGAHGAVDDGDALLQNRGQRRTARVLRVVHVQARVRAGVHRGGASIVQQARL